MSFSAAFVFHGALTDFLPRQRKDTLIHPFSGTPSVKDAIETLGVPHVEVDVIIVNQIAVDFTYLLADADHVEVYPKTETPVAVSLLHLLPPFPAEPAFILDVHLGKLARLLRMTGFDALYERDYADAQIAEIAAAEKRIVLTRDLPLLKRRSITWGYWLRSQQPEEQLSEIWRYFDLAVKVRPFYRCMACNDLLLRIDKQAILHQLEPQTRLHFQEFYRCKGCHKIYWKGSHYERMQGFIRRLQLQKSKFLPDY